MIDTQGYFARLLKANMSEPKPIGGIFLLAASFLAFILPNTIWKVLIYTDHLHGLYVGWRTVSISAIYWLILIFPLNLLVLGLFRWKHWIRGRALFLLGPSVTILAAFLLGMVAVPFAPRKWFAMEAGMPVPASAGDFRANLRGGEFDGDAYYFECDPSDTKELIQALNLEVGLNSNLPGPYTVADWPKLPTGHVRIFSHFNSDKFLGCILMTDESLTHVYVYMGWY